MSRAGWLIWVCLAPCLPAAQLKPETVAAFERYIRAVETLRDQRVSGARAFLWAEESPERRRRARNGEAVVEPAAGQGDLAVPGGLLHDWIGAVFIPGTTLARVLGVVQNYDRHRAIYAPEVIGSKTLERHGNRFKIRLRLLKKKVITVVLNTEHDVEYYPLDGRRWHSRSYSTRIAEVINPGGPGERELPPGNDGGFLWRLYSYWRFAEQDGGVWVECQAVSLTRGVPAGLGWLIEPIIRDLPRESLANTLRATRAAAR